MEPQAQSPKKRRKPPEAPLQSEPVQDLPPKSQSDELPSGQRYKTLASGTKIIIKDNFHMQTGEYI